MKILSIGTIDNKGGAAQVSWELRRRLKLAGHIVNTFARYKYSDEPDIFKIPRKKYQDWLVKIFANDLLFAKSGYILKTKEYLEADIIHCHNLHSNFFNLKDLVKMSSEKPVIWTLHDMWAFTGFAYNSITLRNPNKKRFLLCLWDNTKFMYWMKKKIYAKSKLNIVTVSNWLKHEAEKSILKNQKIVTIHNGIDIDTFKPSNKEANRKQLGLPLNKKIIGTGVKGWIDNQNIINQFKNRDDVYFVAIGHNNIRTENKNFIVLPRTENRQELAKYLGSLDIFLHPTPEDSFGLISSESMSCGIPVVAYAVDALPEIVEHKKSGYLAKYEDIESAIEGINYILGLSKSDYEKMSQEARNRIVSNFSSDLMYQRYLTLYKELLSSNSLRA